MSDLSRDKTIKAVLALVNSERWSTTQGILEMHKEQLWGKEADEIFGDLLNQKKDDDGAVFQVNWSWDILKAARRGGIPGAFERAQGVGARFIIDQEVIQMAQDALASGKQEELDDVFDRYPYLIRMLKHLENQGEQD